MLGVSELNIIEHVEGTEQRPAYDEADAVRITYNETDPTVMSDGIDGATVVHERDDRYFVDYWGYRTGYLWITRAGVRELGAYLLADRAPVPRWLLDAPTDPESLPWWIPDTYDGEPSLPCDRCETETVAGEILTPGSTDGNPDEQFCQDCWDAIRHEWTPTHDPPE